MSVIQGKVVKLDGKYAVVAFERTDMCDRCRACRVSKDSKHVETNVKNTLGANVGDKVKVNMHRTSLVLSSLIYLVPLALVATGAAVGSTLSKAMAALLAAAGLILGFAIALPIDFFVLRRKLRPQMTGFPLDESQEVEDGAKLQ